MSSENPSSNQPLSIKLVVICYTTLFLLSLLWGYFQGRTIPWKMDPSSPHHLSDLLIGIGFGLVVVFLSFISTERFEWGRGLERVFAKALTPLAWWQILTIALASSIGEEFFFRGAMQPVFGLILTSLIFGFIHFPIQRPLIPWTLMALVMGFILGWLFKWRGNLISPITCHFVINFSNLIILNRRTKKPDS